MIRHEFHIVAVASVIIVFAWCAMLSVQIVPIRLAYLTNFRLFAIIWLILIFPTWLIALGAHRPPYPISWTKRWIAGHLRRTLQAAPLIASMALFLPTFSAVKSGIPAFTDYTWDALFIDLDKTLHFADPWRILEPILGDPFVTWVLGWAYNIWMLLIFVGTIYMAIHVPRHLAIRYFLAFFLCWTIGGMLMAVAFASVGPIFVEPLLGDQYFAEKAELLRALNERYELPTMHVQGILLDWHARGEHGFGRGISAMPSMHVSLAFLFWMALRHQQKVISWFFFAFFVTIFLMSIHSGYHYAIDGYVAIILTATIWTIAGRLTRPAVEAEHARDCAPRRSIPEADLAGGS